MNKLFTYLFLFTGYVFAQQITEIKEFKSDLSSYRIDNSILDNTTFVPTINSESDVSASGTFSQVIPIEVFKGINNLQPNLSLVYNSQMNGGMAGEGWNISGLSSITLGGKSLKIDNSNEGIVFDGTDPYYLDGQRLIASNGEFRTEALSAIKIKRVDPTTFTVHFTDGRVSTYKKIGLFDFSVTEMKDAFGNTIKYEYFNDGNVTYIQKISYGDTSLFSINFEYKDNPNRITSYVNGTQIISRKTIANITVRSKEGIYRKYALTHDYTSLKYPRLREVNVYNSKNEALKPLKFKYNSDGSSRKLIKTTESANRFSKNTLTLGSTVQGDFEGNGTVSSIYVINEDEKNNPKSDKNKEFYSSIVHEKLGPIVADLKFDRNLNLHAGKIIDTEGKLSKNDVLFYIDRNIFSKEVIKYNNNSIITSTYRVKAIDPSSGKEFTKSLIIPTGIEINLDARKIYLADDFFELSGDFNNDGLVDVLIFRKESIAFNSEFDDKILNLIDIEMKDMVFLQVTQKLEKSKYPSALYFYELGKEMKNPGSIQLTQLASGITFEEGRVFPINYDRDGITDFLFVDQKKQEFNIKSIKRSSSGSYALTTKLAAQHLAYFQEDSPLVFGDFNGDGLTDFMTPAKLYDITKSSARQVLNEIIIDKKVWWEYINTGKGQFTAKERDFTNENLVACKPAQRAVLKKSSGWQKFWSGKPDRYQFSEYASCGVIATDFNNDGRSDFVAFNHFGKITPGKTDPSFIQNNKIEKLDNIISPQPININTISFIENQPSDKEEYQLNFSNNNYLSFENEVTPFALIGSNNTERNLESFNVGIQFLDPFNGRRVNYDIQTHNFLETKIAQVDNGSGVIQDIEYTPMSEVMISPSAIWEGNKLHENKNLYYKIDQSISNDLKYPYYVNRKQPGLYLVNRINTLFDTKSISKEYRYVNAIQDLSGLGFIGFQRVATSNPYESTRQNGQYLPKELGKDILWSVSLSDPLQENQLIAKTIGNLTGDQYTTKSSVKYKKITSGKSYMYVKQEEVSEDKLRNFSIFKSYTYNTRGFLVSAVTDYRSENGQKSEEKFVYEPDFTSGQSFFAGKIKQHENIETNHNGTFSSKNIYSYNKTNGNVIKDAKYGNNTTAIVSDFKYDAVGNKIEESLSGQGIKTLTTKFEYDASKRFITKTTSPEGKIESTTIDLFGNPLTVTTTLGLKTTYKYDGWGNNIEVLDPYTIKTTLVKQKLDNGKYSLSTSTPGVPSTFVIYDKFDRVIQQKTQSINNKWSFVDIEYDLFGKKIKESEPYFEGETKKWNITEYDALDRITTYTQSTGKIITTCYEGLGVTVDEGTKKTSKHYNSAGQIIKHTDKGGSIVYDYYPNGTLKTADYDGIIIRIQQDGWGNKIELNDPSAGIYIYKYDALGNIQEEISPKGKTVYAYDNFYKLIKENVSSDDNSAIEINYAYDPTTLLPTKTYGTSNGNYYEYETSYDELFRLKGKKETTKDFIYESYVTYDTQNKVKDTSLKTTINAINKVINSKVSYVYDANGFLVEERDALKNKTIKKVTEVNAQGQVKKLDFGNSLRLTTSYDKDFFPSQINLANAAGQSELKIAYTFNAKRQLLEKRNIQFKGLAASNESFTFDELDRLTSEKENNVILNQYVYDPKGRMVYNSEVGKYTYQDQNYKIKSIEFNSKGNQLLENRGLHQIKFNSYKQATEIYLKGKDRISYDFNLFKERSIAYYGSEDTDQNKRPYRKFYTSDKAVEIQFNGSKYKVITYVDGDPYSSSYIQINEITANTTATETNYYVHRDVQGTILALSSTAGVLVEKRLFDAWGNIKKVIHQDGTVNTTLGIIDRGYTGHEHLQSVGLIHMNGRLYDPVLRRFISPDNFVQDPYNTQNFDRYTYVYNNPLIYNDPSGESVVAAIIGVAIALTTHAIMNAVQGIPIWYGMGKTAAIAIGTAVVSYAVSVVSSSISSSIGKTIFQAATRDVISGISSSINGSSFFKGYITSFVTPQADTSSLNISPTLEYAMEVVSGGVNAGISSVISGGNFWQGARQGFILSASYSAVNKFIGSISVTTEEGMTANNENNKTPQNNNGVTVIGNNIILFSEKYDDYLYDNAILQPSSSDVIKIYSHGNWSGVSSLNTPQKISTMLYENSPIWKNYIDGGKKASINIEIHACSVASNSTAIAYKFSKSFPTVTVKATNKYIVVKPIVYIRNNWYGKSYVRSTYRTFLQKGGKWFTIKNGTQINSSSSYFYEVPQK
ncbi:RHS repeat-associated core domain-containing protein [Empedobacter brevis]|uniref:RHS repeat-associated core domain-containing protein n=1 Tax=Empedobacter brevis TaxID=247 RepID=A0AAJ1V958_9FLAO|nr:RHS repeat-associated core domain-containing protein [Empedobacter brevis]MDM1074149.1 RHS repeat-associated core domain-containing protein [Empedobacter brevis]